MDLQPEHSSKSGGGFNGSPYEGLFANAIYKSLRSAPLLIDDLPGAKVFDRSLLAEACDQVLNFEQKLGHLYEDALRALIAASDGVRYLASNLQVFDHAQRTLGELDFLVQNEESGDCIHLELAVKFYLAVKRGGMWAFPGPDPRDNWSRKLQRMIEHQFRLGQRTETKALLGERFGIQSISVEQLIYGRLFLPVNCSENPRLEGMSVGARVYRWLYAEQWSKYLAHVQGARILPKFLWSVELTKELIAELEPVSVDSLLAAGQDRCVLFVPDDSIEPWFLVPPTWPGV